MNKNQNPEANSEGAHFKEVTFILILSAAFQQLDREWQQSEMIENMNNHLQSTKDETGQGSGFTLKGCQFTSFFVVSAALMQHLKNIYIYLFVCPYNYIIFTI